MGGTAAGAGSGQGAALPDGGGEDATGDGDGLAGVAMVTVTVVGAIVTTVIPDGSDGTTVTLCTPGPIPATSIDTTIGAAPSRSRSSEEPNSVRSTELTGSE